MSTAQANVPATGAAEEVADPAAAKKKKMMFLALGLLAVVIGGLLLYLIVFKKEEEEDTPTTGGTTTDKKTKTVVLSKTFPSTATDHVLNFGELELFDSAGTKLNLRSLGTLTATSQYTENGATKFPTSNLIDGDTNTVAHTDVSDFAPAFTYTFTTPQLLSTAIVYNRPDCCQTRADGVSLVAKNSAGTALLTATLTGSKDPQTFTFPA